MGTLIYKTNTAIADADAKVFGDTSVYLKRNAYTIKRMRLGLNPYSGKSFSITVKTAIDPTNKLKFSVADVSSGVTTEILANETVTIEQDSYLYIEFYELLAVPDASDPSDTTHFFPLSEYITVDFNSCFNVKGMSLYLYTVAENGETHTNEYQTVWQGGTIKLGMFDFFNLTELKTYYCPSPLLEDASNGPDSLVVDLRNFKFARIQDMVIRLEYWSTYGYFAANPNVESYKCQFVDTLVLGADSLNATFDTLWLQAGYNGEVDPSACPYFKIKSAGGGQSGDADLPQKSCDLIMNLLYTVDSPVLDNANVILPHVSTSIVNNTAMMNNIKAKFEAVTNGHLVVNGTEIVPGT